MFSFVNADTTSLVSMQSRQGSFNSIFPISANRLGELARIAHFLGIVRIITKAKNSCALSGTARLHDAKPQKARLDQ
jgi:hypothetical protein